MNLWFQVYLLHLIDYAIRNAPDDASSRKICACHIRNGKHENNVFLTLYLKSIQMQYFAQQMLYVFFMQYKI